MSKAKAEESMKMNQVQAQDLIKAINTYHQQRGQLPEQLDVLVPDYLNKLPVTIENQEFAYNTMDVADRNVSMILRHFSSEISEQSETRSWAVDMWTTAKRRT